MQKESKKYLVMGIVMTLLTLIGVTYAYWRANIQGEGSQVTLTLKELKVIFTDTQEIVDNEVIPGWSTSKTFTVENQGNIAFKYDIYIKDLINTLVTEDFLQYKITSSNGYNMEEYATIGKSSEASDFDLGTNISIGGGEIQEYTIEFRYVNSPTVDQSEDMGKTVSGKLMIRENVGTTLYSVLSDGSKYELGERTDFSTVFGGETITQGYNQTGKIYLEEDNYYFAGNPSDNWVRFADKWWRIIRTNSTEGTRLLYAGTSPEGQDGCINYNTSNNTCSTYQWSSNYNNAEYVQWSYALDTIGNALTSWYNSNIVGTNDNMVNTNVAYCNDTSQASKSGNNQWFGANARLIDNKTPTYLCNVNSFGDASKVGMMTADEITFAGGVFNYNSPNTYYYRNNVASGCTGTSGDPCSVTANHLWWTLSPYSFDSGYARMFSVSDFNSSGLLSLDRVNVSNAVRPVITLKPEVKISGSGTTDDPYVPSL